MLTQLILPVFVCLAFPHLAVLDGDFFIGSSSLRHQQQRVFFDFAVVKHLSDLALGQLVERSQLRQICYL